ncbi:translation initiation factor IF-2-like [Physeter macrocephalus]|uniref:Translation initiation factor IF-2-like n=1 Tax=Physeter macrocephalus TaxID=9755 RepID=A0A9W2WWR7_PHYMC|nr:translation initiation factor IF-2-like [Physeter catodon]
MSLRPRPSRSGCRRGGRGQGAGADGAGAVKERVQTGRARSRSGCRRGGRGQGAGADGAGAVRSGCRRGGRGQGAGADGAGAVRGAAASTGEPGPRRATSGAVHPACGLPFELSRGNQGPVAFPTTFRREKRPSPLNLRTPAHFSDLHGQASVIVRSFPLRCSGNCRPPLPLAQPSGWLRHQALPPDSARLRPTVSRQLRGHRLSLQILPQSPCVLF